MDAFYASVEQRDDPSLREKPVAVGRGAARGVVAAASYEARKFGVRSAMPSVVAQRKCPELIFVPPRFEVYKEVSAQIHNIFQRFTHLVQPLSLDEAYLDVSEEAKRRGSASAVAEAIRLAIREETGLTASAGVSYNRFLAKLASDFRKPDGLFIITPAQGAHFVASLPIERFHGIGPATARRMKALGIYTGADLRGASRDALRAHFGKIAEFYYNIARGVDDRPVDPHRVRKSMGKETTFEQDIVSLPDAQTALRHLAARVWSAYIERGLTARTVTLKIKSADFRIMTRAASVAEAITQEEVFIAMATTLLEEAWPLQKGVRLLGLTFSSFTQQSQSPNSQLTLI